MPNDDVSMILFLLGYSPDVAIYPSQMMAFCFNQNWWNGQRRTNNNSSLPFNKSKIIRSGQRKKKQIAGGLPPPPPPFKCLRLWPNILIGAKCPRISIHLSGNLSNIGAVGHGPQSIKDTCPVQSTHAVVNILIYIRSKGNVRIEENKTTIFCFRSGRRRPYIRPAVT
jgi:hypothetical protein